MAPIVLMGNSCINLCSSGDNPAKLITGTIYPTRTGINAAKAVGLAAEISNAPAAITKAAPHPSAPHKAKAWPMERLYGDKLQCGSN